MNEDPSGGSASQAEKEEVDARSIYVGNVRLNNPLVLFQFGIYIPILLPGMLYVSFYFSESHNSFYESFFRIKRYHS